MEQNKDRSEHIVRVKREAERARATHSAVIVPVLSRRSSRTSNRVSASVNDIRRSDQALLEEAMRLAMAIDLTIAHSQVVRLSTIQPSTLLGKGKVQELAKIVHDEEISLVIVDYDLSPIQQRNLERSLKAKVLDRTGLILEIFGRRAQTREGVLQVELAHLTYQKSRLVRSWTHLERQRGGKGFLGGPGETQIEADRRVIQSKISDLKEKLQEVRRTRTLHRSRRKEAPAPTVALVGYTNAGKSTLFNRLCDGSVQAEDLLFATLDPTLRKLTLPAGSQVVLSDTVGFISNLPTPLVAAFRATLEEVVEADIIVHVRDISHPDSDVQRHDVLDVLTELGVIADPDTCETRDGRRIIEAWNKMDLLPEADQSDMQRTAARGGPTTVLLSAVTGEGSGNLLEVIEKTLLAMQERETFHVAVHDGEGRAWLFRHGTILAEATDPDGSSHLHVALNAQRMGAARQRFPISAARLPH